MITTPHLELRAFTPADADAFFNLTQDAGFNLFPINIYRQTSLESSRAWIERAMELNFSTGMGKWGVWEIRSQTLIGLGGLTPWICSDEKLVDITYRLRESAWGRGYGIEMARALIHYGFTKLGLKEITATITPDNLASQKIASKLGMKFDKKIVLLGVDTELYRLQSLDR